MPVLIKNKNQITTGDSDKIHCAHEYHKIRQTPLPPVTYRSGYKYGSQFSEIPELYPVSTKWQHSHRRPINLGAKRIKQRAEGLFWEQVVA